jgi:hypothetical protein
MVRAPHLVVADRAVDRVLGGVAARGVRTMKALIFAAALLLAPLPAWAIPACWTIEPRPGEHPFDGPTATPTDCGADQHGFVMHGAGALTGLYIEITPEPLAILRVPPESVSPHAVFFYGAGFGYGGVVDNIYIAQWLLGSDWQPPAAEWAHANGFAPQWGPYPVPTPLEHSPEPTTLLLVGSTLVGMSLVARRARRKWRVGAQG